MNTSGWSRVALVVCHLLAFAIVAPGLSRGDDESVVVSRPGVVFHKPGSSDVRGRGHEKELARALATGYVPCEKCFGKASPFVVAGAGVAGTSGTAARGRSFALGRGSIFVSPGFGGDSFNLRIPNGVCRCEKAEAPDPGAALDTSSCSPSTGC